jgi:cytochrome b561
MAHVSRYHPVLVALHWLSAVLIIAALALGALVMAPMPNSDPMKLEALRSHMGGGILIASLMLVRLLVRRRSAQPPAASAGHPMLDRLAFVSHRLLYVAALGMAASGLFLAFEAGLPAIVLGSGSALPADLWIFPARTVHFLVSQLLMALIALHLAGALYHMLIRKDGLLGRMWFGRRRQPGNDSTPVLGGTISGARR